MEKRPKITVIIPVYNGDRFVLDAIKSVESQTLKPEKIIAVDDGSTDNTLDTVTRYACSIPLEYIKKDNGGPNSARNVGLQKSTSEYVAFLDADDEWRPTKLEKQIEVFRNSECENLGVVYCQYSMIDENGNDLPDMPVFKIDKTIRGNIFKKLLVANKIASSASGVLIKRECFDKVGLFDEELRIGEDWDMWLRIAEKYDYDYDTDILVKIRRHGNNAQSNRSYVFENEITFYNKWTTKSLPKFSIPRMWANVVCSRVIARLPEKDFLVLANKKLSKRAKRKMFRIMLGSFKLYLCAALFFMMLMNSVTILISLASEIKKFSKKIILVIRSI